MKKGISRALIIAISRSLKAVEKKVLQKVLFLNVMGLLTAGLITGGNVSSFSDQYTTVFKIYRGVSSVA